MSAMDKVKRSREAEELGSPVEALSERVRALSEEARAFMAQLGEERERRAQEPIVDAACLVGINT